MCRKLLLESGMWTISTTFSPAFYAQDPGMANDPRHLVAPPWDQKRLSLAVATATKEDQQNALRRLGDEESTVASVLRGGGTMLAGTDSPLDIPATSLHLNLRAQVKFGLQPWQGSGNGDLASSQGLRPRQGPRYPRARQTG